MKIKKKKKLDLCIDAKAPSNISTLLGAIRTWTRKETTFRSSLFYLSSTNKAEREGTMQSKGASSGML